MNKTVNYMGRNQLRNQLLRSQSNRRRLWMIGIGIIITIIIFSAGIFTKTVTAERNIPREKLVTSVKINDGDTLWSIAANYYTDDYDNYIDYIEEIKKSNGLSSDIIQAGNYIIVPYFAEVN